MSIDFTDAWETNAWDQVGTVELLRTRVYTIDPADDVTTLDESAVVEPGTYPLYCNGNHYWWTMTGNVNRRGFERLKPGTFAMHLNDEATPHEVTFSSRRFTAPELADLLLDDPVFQEGAPEQRLRFEFTSEHDPRAAVRR